MDVLLIASRGPLVRHCKRRCGRTRSERGGMVFLSIPLSQTCGVNGLSAQRRCESAGAGARGRNVAGWFFLLIPLSPLLGLADLWREWIISAASVRKRGTFRLSNSRALRDRAERTSLNSPPCSSLRYPLSDPRSPVGSRSAVAAGEPPDARYLFKHALVQDAATRDEPISGIRLSDWLHRKAQDGTTAPDSPDLFPGPLLRSYETPGSA